MTQDDLDVHHKAVCDAVQLWADGLITDLEFSVLMAEDRKALPADANPAGLIDPNTGLLYPTKRPAPNDMVHQALFKVGG